MYVWPGPEYSLGHPARQAAHRVGDDLALKHGDERLRGDLAVLLVDGPRIRAGSLALVQVQHRGKLLFLEDQVSRVLGGYLRRLRPARTCRKAPILA
jgi:hypothetical protein